MPQITITDDGQVEFDGQLAGNIADTIANNPKLASDIQRAYDAWHPGATKTKYDNDVLAANVTRLQAQVDSLNNQLTAISKQAADDLATAQAKATTDKAALQSQIYDLTAKLGTLPQVLADAEAACGGNDALQAIIAKYKADQAKAAALAQGAAIIDQLSTLGLSPDEISQAVADKLQAAQAVTADVVPAPEPAESVKA